MMYSVGLPNVDFKNIRPYGQPPSTDEAFEELSSILIEHGMVGVEWREGVRFERFGNPDGGRDGQGVFRSGEVWAWQVKYLFRFDSRVVSQITESVKRALIAESRLKRYYVVLPIDLPRSARDRWADAVRRWTDEASGKGMEVDFRLVDKHMLLTSLTEPRHAGLVRYWFDVTVLSPKWQQDHVTEAIANAGPRYTPEVHVGVAAAGSLDAVGRTEAYVREWQLILKWFREVRLQMHWTDSQGGDALDNAVSQCLSVLDRVDGKLERMIAALRSAGEPPEVQEPLRQALEALSRINELLLPQSEITPRYLLQSRLRECKRASDLIDDGLNLAAGQPARAAAERRLLLTGHAGSGKTHLLCDTARHRTKNGAPTILLFGQDFDGRALLNQIGELCGLGKTDDALAVLDAASEAADCMGLLIIDALNESAEPHRWRDATRKLSAMCKKYPRIALVLSCRTGFVKEVVGDNDLVQVEHAGFAEATTQAVLRFTEAYGLEPSTFASLSPEFGNPLYLKLACEALKTLGERRFRFGVAGLTTVTEAFLEAVNDRLSEAGRCDFDPSQNYVDKCVRELAEFGPDPWLREDVQRITDAQLSHRSWSKSLLKHLIAEGVLIELPGQRLRFGYERLGDIARASIIADHGLDAVQDWLDGLDDDGQAQYGVFEALAIILPDRYETEIIDLEHDHGSDFSTTLLCALLDTLALRNPGSVTPRVRALAKAGLSLDRPTDAHWQAWFPMACIPGHGLNAEFLHAYLSELKLPDRDIIWSAWLENAPIGGSDAPTQVIRRLIDWVWGIDPATRTDVPADVAELAVLTLGWLLASKDATIRNDATKALVSLGERCPAAFTRTIIRFKGANDPYITERLTAAACGIVLRNCTDKTTAQIADAVQDLLGGAWPQHLLTRDYARRVFTEAAARGRWEPQRPSVGARSPIGSRTAEEIRVLAEEANFNPGPISNRLIGVNSRINSRVRELIQRQVREKRGDIESNKYKKIALYETLGRIADNYDVRPQEDAPSEPYQYPEQVISRDFDPTVLVRVREPRGPERIWFAPGKVDFALGSVADASGTLAGLPDPLDLIAVQDPDETLQLVLASRRRWHQQIPEKDEDGHLSRRWAWMHITAYLAPLTKERELQGWANARSWLGRPAPEVPNVPVGLLGAYPHDPHWEHICRNIDTRGSDNGEQLPAWLSRAAAWYIDHDWASYRSRNGWYNWDDEVNCETSGWLPSPKLYELLDLDRGVDFAWKDEGGVAVQSPSAELYSPPTLVLRRDLMARLAENGLTLFWEVMIGNQPHKPHPDNDCQWLSAYASYLFDEGQVRLVTAQAAHLTTNDEVDYSLAWTPLQTG